MGARPSGGPIRLLYVTASAATGRSVVDVAAAARAGGADAVQVREPALSDREAVALARAVAAAIRPVGGRVLVNDRVDLALAAGADGVHLKSDGIGAAEARAVARQVLGSERGAGFLVGRSTHDAASLVAAHREGASHLTLGPLNASPGKTPLGAVAFGEALAAARVEVGGPLAPAWLALGGVGLEDVADLARLAAPSERWGVAAIRAFQEPVDDAGTREVAAALARAMARSRDDARSGSEG